MISEKSTNINCFSDILFYVPTYRNNLTQN